MNGIPLYHFRKDKYGDELLIDLIRLESIERYLRQTPRQSLSYYDITLINEGEGSFTIDDYKFLVEKNQLFFSAPGQIREWKIDAMPLGLVLIFEEEFLCNFFNDSLFVQKLSFFNHPSTPPQLFLSPQQGEFLRGIMVQIEKEIGSDKDNHLLRALLYQVLAWLNTQYLSHYKIERFSVNNRIIHFSQLVDKYYATEHSIAFYASEMCITPGHMNELVKKEWSITAKQFLINRQIMEAKRLLCYSNLSVAEIAWKLGFNEPSYFIRLFRNETKFSPLTFRKQHP